MNPEKKKRLEDKGWTIGDADQFLNAVTPESFSDVEDTVMAVNKAKLEAGVNVGEPEEKENPFMKGREIFEDADDVDSEEQMEKARQALRAVREFQEERSFWDWRGENEKKA